jgi:hypothetical protein
MIPPSVLFGKIDDQDLPVTKKYTGRHLVVTKGTPDLIGSQDLIRLMMVCNSS